MANHPSIKAAHSGYSAARSGRPLDPDKYSDRGEQTCYEVGRLWVFQMVSAGIPPPRWRAGRNLPLAVRLSVKRAYSLVPEAGADC